jgi:hypothetical protein
VVEMQDIGLLRKLCLALRPQRRHGCGCCDEDAWNESENELVSLGRRAGTEVSDALGRLRHGRSA